MSRAWAVWAKALGPRASMNDREADLAALIRSVKYLVELITCVVIIAGVARHWGG